MPRILKQNLRKAIIYDNKPRWLHLVHSSVSFSKEVEADGQLTYLDVLLTKNEKGLKQLSTEKILIQDCTTNGKACRQYNIKKVPCKACYIVPTKFAAHTN